MATKRDQLHAHQFLVQRVVSGLVTREADPEEPPFRRPGGAAIGSIVIGVLALVAVFVYGLVVPGGDSSWRDGKSVIMAEETGARYVFIDGRLHPVPNYASALLALGENAETKSVARASLAGVPRGPEIGIDGAPDALPAPEDLLGGGWSLCSRSAEDESGAIVHESVLLVGAEPGGGQALGDGEAVLVEVSTSGDQYLLWRGFRHRIRQSDTRTVELAMRSTPRARVGMPLVDVLPAGESIGPIPVPDAGARSSAVPGNSGIRVGQLLEVRTSGGSEYYLAEPEQLRPISPLQYDIQRAYPDTRNAYNGGEPVALPLGLAAAGQARQSPRGDDGPGSAPTVRPAMADNASGRGTVCGTYQPGAVLPRLHTSSLLPAGAMADTTSQTQDGLPIADAVYVEPGHAALIEVLPSAEVSVGTLMLVTDQGRGHPLAGPAVQGILGYGNAQPVRLPAGLVDRIPLGVGLDPSFALQRRESP